jgi:hypothetical protein
MSESEATHEAPTELHSFEEFWPYYVRQHLHPVNRALHFVGLSIAGRLLLKGVRERRLAPVLLAPVAGYGLSWIGHYFFEKNKPASFSYPLWSFRGDLHMWSKIAQRKMAAEIDQALTNP